MSIAIDRRSALAGLGLLATARRAWAQSLDPLSVRLDFSPWGIHAAMHLANQRGWFREARLAVDVQDGRGSGNTLQLVNAGQVDVGQIQVGLIGQARGNGATVRCFADWGRRTDLAVMVDRDAPMQKVADFRGKSIVVFAASPWAPFIDLWLRTGGLDRSSATIMVVDPAALWGTYSAGRADAVMSTPASALPVIDKARPSRAILAEDAGIAYPSYGLVATQAMLATKADALKRLVAVQQQAWMHIQNGGDAGIEDGVAAMIAARPDAKLDPVSLREQIRLSIQFFDTPATTGKPLGWQAEADWAAGLRSLQEAGAVKPGWTATDYYTNGFIA